MNFGSLWEIEAKCQNIGAQNVAGLRIIVAKKKKQQWTFVTKQCEKNSLIRVSKFRLLGDSNCQEGGNDDTNHAFNKFKEVRQLFSCQLKEQQRKSKVLNIRFFAANSPEEEEGKKSGASV